MKTSNKTSGYLEGHICRATGKSKKVFQQKQQALKFIKKTYDVPENWNAYWCDLCQGFHIGHKPMSTKLRETQREVTRLTEKLRERPRAETIIVYQDSPETLKKIQDLEGKLKGLEALLERYRENYPGVGSVDSLKARNKELDKQNKALRKLRDELLGKILRLEAEQKIT